MTGAERAQAAKALVKANITDVIPPQASVRDVVDLIRRRFHENQMEAIGKI